LVCLLAMLAAAAVHAQAFPSKLVTIVVPFSAGAGADALARAAGRKMSDTLKQPVIVENLPGADTIIGTRRVTKAAPDGYTILINTPALLFVRHNHPNEGDIVADLAPVTVLAAGPSALSVSTKTGVTSLQELKAYCSKPDAKCSWGSGDLFLSMIGNDVMTRLGLADKVTEVRYKGANAAMNDLIGGHLTMLMAGTAIFSQQHATGSVKILGVAGESRADGLPDVPTFKEAGIGSLGSAEIWVGVFAPKNTPDDVRTTIANALKDALKDAEVQTAMRTMQMRAMGTTPAEFGAILRADEAAIARQMSAPKKP
jgi:tripartite-type tricarboxylate transporter receptor subunit TctC